MRKLPNWHFLSKNRHIQLILSNWCFLVLKILGFNAFQWIMYIFWKLWKTPYIIGHYLGLLIKMTIFLPENLAIKRIWKKWWFFVDICTFLGLKILKKWNPITLTHSNGKNPGLKPRSGTWMPSLIEIYFLYSM